MKQKPAALVHPEVLEGMDERKAQFTPGPPDNSTRLEDYELDQFGRKIAIKKILVPTDFSPASAKALEVAVSLAKEYGANVTVLHVIDVLSPLVSGSAESLMNDLWADGSAKIEQLSRSLSGRAKAYTVLAEGLPWEEIAMRSEDFDLLVLGTRRCKSVWNGFRQHTSGRVIENSKCPVLTISEQQAVEKLAWRTSLNSDTMPSTR